MFSISELGVNSLDKTLFSLLQSLVCVLLGLDARRQMDTLSLSDTGYGHMAGFFLMACKQK